MEDVVGTEVLLAANVGLDIKMNETALCAEEPVIEARNCEVKAPQGPQAPRRGGGAVAARLTCVGARTRRAMQQAHLKPGGWFFACCLVVHLVVLA